MTPSPRLGAEFVGTAFLLATVVGSGLMAERLSGGNVAVALLGNTVPTGAILYVLITMLASISGVHFNPAVTLVFALKRDLGVGETAGFVVARIIGGLIGVWAARLMFEEVVLQASLTARTGAAQWFSEGAATFGLILTILRRLRRGRRLWRPPSVSTSRRNTGSRHRPASPIRP